MKLLFAGLLSVGLLTSVVEQRVPQTPASSIGYVSMQKILTESLDAKAAEKRLEELRQMKAKDISGKQKALEATRLELASSGGLFFAAKRARLKTQESQQQSEIQQANQSAQTEFLTLQRQLQTDLRRDLNAIVAQLAKRKGIQLVLNEDNAVIWASTGTELTSEVLDQLNQAARQRATQ